MIPFRRTLPALLLTGALVVPAAIAETGPHVDNSQFTLTLPAGFGQFAKQEQTVASPNGPIKQTTWVSKAKDGSAFIVSLSKMPGKILDPKAMMDSGRDSLLKSLNATLENESKKEFEGHPGRSILYSASSPRPIFARTDLVISNDSMFQLIYLGFDQSTRQAPEITNSFGSFEVKESAPAAAKANTTAPAATPAPVQKQADKAKDQNS
ncbi:MAG: hypothetical protein WBX15_13695 [Thermoanaerobaculia bacterium]